MSNNDEIDWSCPECGTGPGILCDCQPPITIARAYHTEEHCENCGKQIEEFQAICLWADEVVTHWECQELD